jgi:transketolase
MAIAERLLAAEFNRPGHEIVDHRTYCFVGDGCLMEGISHEAASLAGTLGLSKLIVFYDDNGISIDGETKGWFTDNTPERFEAYGWNVISHVDGHDVDAVDRAIKDALGSKNQPTLICCKTTIGKGSPHKQGTSEAHGAALGEKEVAATREALGWTYPPFVIPDAIYSAWNARDRGASAEDAWAKRFADYRAAHRDLAAEFTRRIHGELPATWSETVSAFAAAQKRKGGEHRHAEVIAAGDRGVREGAPRASRRRGRP